MPGYQKVRGRCVRKGLAEMAWRQVGARRTLADAAGPRP